MSKERGMIFNAEMVRALQDGRKTQTRRPVKPQPTMYEPGQCVHVSDMINDALLCPHGKPGDRIWVRETWAEAGAGAPDLILYRANYPDHVPSHYENVPLADDIRWTPSIHMPRWASRIMLEITDVRVERLNSITEEDARAEGIIDGGCLNCGESEPCGCSNPEPDATDAFAALWMSIYGEGRYQANPWVWVIEFKRVEGAAA
jgi:hypothetical protein